MNDIHPEVLRREDERTFYFVALDTPELWPEVLHVDTTYFVAFVAMDARQVSADLLGQFSARLIDQGLAYLCAWGPDCERVHDIVDETIVERDMAGEAAYPEIMTTWHSGESLEEALEFFVRTAWPPDSSECRAWITIVVGDEGLTSQIRQALAEQLN